MPHGHCYLWLPSLIGGAFKTLTALAFLATAIWLAKMIHKMIQTGNTSKLLREREIQLESQAVELAKTNTALLAEIEMRKRIENELRKSEGEVLNYIEGVRDYAVIRLSPEGVVTSWNAGATQIKGYEPSEIIGQSLSKFYSEDDFTSGKPAWALKEAARCGRFEDEGWRVKKDGTQFWANVVITAIYDKNRQLIGFSKFTRDLTEKKHAEDKLHMLNESLDKKVRDRTADLEISIQNLRQSETNLKELTTRLQSVQEDERQRISREIHDVLGQSLSVLKMELFEIKKDLTPEQLKAKDKLTAIILAVDELVKTVRKIASELRPAALEDLGLVAAVEWWLNEFQNRSGLKCRFSTNLDNIQLPSDISTALFRVLQEALTNVLRHSGSQKVDLSLNHENEQIELKVRDFGKGVQNVFTEQTKSLGLIGMRERIDSLGGKFSLENITNQGGALLTAIIPMPGRVAL